MSFLNPETFGGILSMLTDALGGSAEKYVMSRPILGTLIRLGTDDGLSGRSILDAYRTAGGKTADSTFWNLRRQVLNETNDLVTPAALASGSPDAVTEIAGGRAGTYRIDFNVYAEMESAGGLPVNMTLPRTVLQSGELDVNAALDEMEQRGSSYPQGEGGTPTYLGFEVTGIYRYTG